MIVLKRRILILIIITVASFMSFWNKSYHDLQEWDESRNGVNAYEMVQNGDFVNFHYNNKPDTWNAKPPLMIWLIVASYKVFGFNEFALRFPSAVSSIVFFILCFLIVELLEGGFLAFLTCLILLSCKAILGNHIGLTGDFDMLLVMFLTASVYTFVLYCNTRHKNAIFLTGLFTALAFYTKGPASLVLVPGLILYVLLRQQALNMLKDWKVWVSLLCFLLIAGSWIAIVLNYGKTTTGSFYGSKNAVETMLIHDTFGRLTDADFDHTGEVEKDYFFFFTALDARLNLWNYLFYLSLLMGIFFLFKNRKDLAGIIKSEENKMVLLAICLIVPLALLLSFASTKHDWYLAPIFMFIVFLTTKGMIILCRKFRWFYIVVYSLLAFTLTRHIYYIHTQPTEFHSNLTGKQLKNRTVIVTVPMTQNLFLYLKWQNVTILPSDITAQKGMLILAPEKELRVVYKNATAIRDFENYCLAEIK